RTKSIALRRGAGSAERTGPAAGRHGNGARGDGRASKLMEPTQDEADEPQDGTETAQEETDSSQAGSDALSPGELDISQPFADAPPRKVNFYFFDDIEIVINTNSEIG